MAWIKIETTLPGHRKTKKLARLLDVDILEAVGVLAHFWIWALQYADDSGRIKGDSDDVADGVCWKGDSDLLMHALKKSGFIDDGNIVHDWESHEGAYRQKIRNDRERLQRKRAAVKEEPCHVAATFTQQSTLSRRREDKNREEVNRGEKKDVVANLSPVTEEEIKREKALVAQLESYGIHATQQDIQDARDLIEVYGQTEFERAAEIAVQRSRKTLPYIRGILKNGGGTRVFTGDVGAGESPGTGGTGADRREKARWHVSNCV